jgi:preprotein translocase subunit SecG
MIQTLTIIHAVISVFLVVFVLLQFGKGAEAGIFSGGDGAIFSSSQSGNLLTRITTVLVILFLGLSVALAALRSKQDTKSIFSNDQTVSEPILDESLLGEPTEKSAEATPTPEAQKKENEKVEPAPTTPQP